MAVRILILKEYHPAKPLVRTKVMRIRSSEERAWPLAEAVGQRWVQANDLIGCDLEVATIQ